MPASKKNSKQASPVKTKAATLTKTTAPTKTSAAAKKPIAKAATPSKIAKKSAVKPASKKTNESPLTPKSAVKKVNPVTKKVEESKISKTTKETIETVQKVKKSVSKTAQVAKTPTAKKEKFVAKEEINETKVTKGTKNSSNQEKTKSSALKTTITGEMSQKNFYNDEELVEFKEIIDEKLAVAKDELRLINEEVARMTEMGIEDRHFNPEDATGSIEKETLSANALRQVQYIQHLENALIRIKNRTYGICRVTGKLIGKDRLKAVPHATLSMEAKLLQNK